MVTKFGSSDVILHNPTASYNLVENLTNYRLYLRSYLNTLVLMCANAKMMWKTFAAVENPKEVEQESPVWPLLVALLNDKSYFTFSKKCRGVSLAQWVNRLQHDAWLRCSSLRPFSACRTPLAPPMLHRSSTAVGDVFISTGNKVLSCYFKL